MLPARLNHQRYTHELLIGLSITILSCFITSVANSALRKDAILALNQSPSYRFRWIAVVAVGLLLVGAALDVVALGFIPLSLRACSTVLAIPVNTLVAYFLLGEVMSIAQGAGVFMIIVGALLAMIFGSKDSGDDLTPDQLVETLLSDRVILFVAVTLPLYICAIGYVRRSLVRSPRNRVNRAIVLCLSAYITAYQCCWTNSLAKFFSELSSPVASVVLALLASLSGLLQLMYLQWMLRLFDASVCIPQFQVLATMLMITFGFICFNELPRSLGPFLSGLATATVGVVIVALNADSTKHVVPPLQVRGRSRSTSHMADGPATPEGFDEENSLTWPLRGGRTRTPPLH